MHLLRRDAPTIAQASSGRRRTHASAISVRLIPSCSAIGRSRSTAARVSSFSTRPMKTFIASLAARESLGGVSPRRYLPVSTPWASGDQTICEIPLASHSGNTSASGACHSIEYCGCEETNRSGRRCRSPLESGRQPFAEAQVPGLALGDDLLQRLDRLFDRHVGVEAMALIEIDVVGLQPLQRGIDLLGYLRGR